MYFVIDGNEKGVSRYLRETRIWQGIFKRRGEQEEKKIICSRGKFKHILNSSEKVFYSGNTKFSYTAYQ